MTDHNHRKQCPYAFNNPAGLHNMNCLEDDCMAWKPELPLDKMKGDSWNALVEYIALERGYPKEMAEDFCKSEAKGHCKLIEGGSR